jgi:SIR2-like domain
VAKAMVLDGRVVPLLGAGANLCGRTRTAWAPGSRLLPSGSELADHLATYCSYPDKSRDLGRVSQYVSAVLGDAPLYHELHELFVAEYEPTSLHRFLAEVPGLVRALPTKPREPNQLIVTTNYDDALERAFIEAGEEFDLVTYVCDGDDRGKFLHRAPGAQPTLIERPNEYAALSFEERTVILKIHGAVDRDDPERDSYVITEDHYIDYLTRTDVANLLPITLAAKLRQSHILFLGYSLRDWNLRAIFHRIWQERRRSCASWAIQRAPEQLEVRFWQKRGVEILDFALDRYVAELSRNTRALHAAEAAA